MKVVGLITEYNPFHNGHKYHLETSKKLTGSNYSISVMSGNFVQRGEPALVDKWTRTKMAINNGIDLVIELPFVYASQSAEFFAYGAIKILDMIGIVDSICFGSEHGKIQELDEVADILVEEPKEYQQFLKKHLSKGSPFPKARSKAMREYFDIYINKNITVDFKNILANPNNILGIEYIKALKKINSSIVPHTIKRVSANYNSSKLSGHISSATAIRHNLIQENNISQSIPHSTKTILDSFFSRYGKFNKLSNYNNILLYILRTSSTKQLQKIYDVNEGLDNRIKKISNKYSEINKVLKSIKTKRYTFTRLQRILIHLLLNLNEEKFKTFLSAGPQYIRVLGATNKGCALLKKAKKTSKLPIITKLSTYKDINSTILNNMIEYDIKSTDVFFLGLNDKTSTQANLDYYTSPYIKT